MTPRDDSVAHPPIHIRLADPRRTTTDRPEDDGAWSDAWPLIDWLFLAVTGFIVWHAVRFRDESGSPDMVRLLFGCIAAMFFFKVLFEDVLRVARF